MMSMTKSSTISLFLMGFSLTNCKARTSVAEKKAVREVVSKGGLYIGENLVLFTLHKAPKPLSDNAKKYEFVCVYKSWISYLTKSNINQASADVETKNDLAVKNSHQKFSLINVKNVANDKVLPIPLWELLNQTKKDYRDSELDAIGANYKQFLFEDGASGLKASLMPWTVKGDGNPMAGIGWVPGVNLFFATAFGVSAVVGAPNKIHRMGVNEVATQHRLTFEALSLEANEIMTNKDKMENKTHDYLNDEEVIVAGQQHESSKLVNTNFLRNVTKSYAEVHKTMRTDLAYDQDDYCKRSFLIETSFRDAGEQSESGAE